MPSGMLRKETPRIPRPPTAATTREWQREGPPRSWKSENERFSQVTSLPPDTETVTRQGLSFLAMMSESLTGGRKTRFDALTPETDAFTARTASGRMSVKPGGTAGSMISLSQHTELGRVFLCRPG